MSKEKKEATVTLKIEGPSQVSLKVFNGTIYDIDLKSKGIDDLYSTRGLLDMMQKSLDKQIHSIVVMMGFYPKVRY